MGVTFRRVSATMSPVGIDTWVRPARQAFDIDDQCLPQLPAGALPALNDIARPRTIEGVGIAGPVIPLDFHRDGISHVVHELTIGIGWDRSRPKSVPITGATLL